MGKLSKEWQPYWQPYMDQLEAENKKLKSDLTSTEDSLRHFEKYYIQRIAALESQLAKLGELPDKWLEKDRYDHIDTSKESKTMTRCANELEAQLDKIRGSLAGCSMSCGKRNHSLTVDWCPTCKIIAILEDKS